MSQARHMPACMGRGATRRVWCQAPAVAGKARSIEPAGRVPGSGRAETRRVWCQAPGVCGTAATASDTREVAAGLPVGAGR
jgi:hypothetical protein